MKFNIAFPSTGSQKIFEVDDERKIRAFIDKRLAQEVEGEALGDQFKGYVFKISGGFDKEGFPMKQGVLVPNRVQVLLGKGTSCYRPRRDGERKRKSVRGCIVSHEISVLNLVIVKKGPEEVAGLTDKYVPRRLGPKRANKIRKLFDLSKEDDVRKYVIRRELAPKVPKEGKDGEAGAPAPTTTKSGKPIRPRTKAPKIQRLITPALRQRKRHERSLKRRRYEKSLAEAAEYAKLKLQRAREKRQSTLSTRRSQSQRRESQKQDASATATAAAAAAAAGKPEAKAKGPLSPAAAKGKAEPKAKGAPAPTSAKPKAPKAPKAKAAEGKGAAAAAPKAPAAKPKAKAAEGKGAAAPKAAGEKKPKEKSAKK